MKRAVLVLLALLALTALLLWWLRGVQEADPGYAPKLAGRTWNGVGPAVAIDDAHWNVHTAARGYAPFAKLLLADGYVVLDRGNVASDDVLATAKVIVIANALGVRGTIRQIGQLAGIRLDALGGDAFTDDEIDRVDAWVRRGGSLLLVADHAPAGRAAEPLAERFGVMMHDRFVYDPDHCEEGAPTLLVFTRQNKMLGIHPIMDGHGAGDAVNRIVTFTGQALDGPPGAAKLLMFSGTAYETPRRSAGPEDRSSVAGLAQALALTYGQGRVVVLGDAAVVTAQLAAGMKAPIGLAWPNADNERFARNIMGWLSRAGE